MRSETYGTTKALRDAILDFLNDHYAHETVHLRVTVDVEEHEPDDH